MTKDHRDAVSAWLDREEAQQDEVIEQLRQSDELSRTLSRYQLIGDVMRGETAPHYDPGFADRVAESLAQEPAIIAAPKPGRTTARAQVVSLFRQLGHFALAASVTGLVILGVQRYTADQLENQSISPAQTLPTMGVASPVSLQTVVPAEGQTGAGNDAAYQRQRIQAYLVDHQQQLRLGLMREHQQARHDKAADESQQEQQP